MRKWLKRGRSTHSSDSASGSKPTKVFPTGIKAFAVPEIPESAVVDIVFVHGLTGHREKTWTTEGSSPWPQTLLPVEIPCARILTFGYDANIVSLLDMVSKNRIGDHASGLVTSLVTFREKDNTSNRPIIFVAHSLGGLVCEDALLTSKDSAESHLNSLVSCTKGILFLGTPHGGSSLAGWAESLARYIGLVKQTNSSILEVLKADSEVLDRIQASFHAMIRNRPIGITCFYEQLPLPGVGLVVPKHSATISGYTPIGIHSNHMNMAKFDANDDPGFESVVGELRRWVRELKPIPATRKDNPKPLFLVQFIRDQHFVGRSSILDSIESRLKKSRRIALAGIGGVGKSQIAIEYCYRFRESNPQANIFWIYCSTVKRLLQEYKNIARRLNLPRWDDPKANTLQMVFEWLSEEDHGTWLIILDNADEHEIFSAPISPIEGDEDEPVALVDYLPRSPNGSIIITTRDSRVGSRLTDREQPITVSEFDLEEACQLLKFKLASGEGYVDDAHKLVNELECLPLAITHAAAYIHENGISVAKYIDILQADDSELISLLDRERLVDHRRDSKSSSSIMQTWKISFDQIQRQHQRAAKILSLMAVLDRQGIPKLLLRNDSERESDFIEAIGVLKAYSLISSETEGEKFDLHRLVQVFTQSWLDLQKTREDFEKAALQLLSIKFPYVKYESWELCEMLLPHVQRVLVFRDLSDTSILHRATLLSNMGWYEMEMGRYNTAYQGSEKSYIERKKLLGKEHPDTLNSMITLAAVLHHQGKYKDAEKLLRETLEIGQMVLDKKHPDMLAIINNLALALEKQVKHKEAEELHRQTLKITQEVLGKEHPNTLNSMSYLALVLHRQGKHKEAEELHRQTLKTRQEVLSKEHPDTLNGMYNLASVLGDQGKHEEAEELNRETLKIRQKVLGKKHPDTLKSMQNLAVALGTQGKHEEADELNRESLEIGERVLDKEHPDTLLSMSNLALRLGHQGKQKDAEELFRRTLEIRQKVLGIEHPETLISMSNLALALGYQGKHDEADELNRESLEIRERVLGKEHPDTLNSMHNLAWVIDRQGKHDEAEELNRETLEIRERVLGKEHLDTLNSKYSLAWTLRSQGKYEEAEELFRRTLEIRESVLGKEHPGTLQSMHNLASVLGRQGKHDEAEELFRRTSEIRERVLGKENPDTLRSMHNVAWVLGAQGKHDEAEELFRQTLEIRQKVFGIEDPDTLDSMHSLASVLGSQGKHDEAEELFRRTSEIRERVLGKENPNTLNSVHSLGGVLTQGI